MADSLQNYAIGASGVNVDKSEILMDDSELRSAQNATRDALGIDGGVRKRPGLKKFNASTMTDAVLGGIGLPLPLLVNSIGGVAIPQQPTDPTLDDGDGGSGVGSGAGSGGGTGDGGGAIGGAQVLHGTTIFWGRNVSSGSVVGETRGWYADSQNFTGANSNEQDFAQELGFAVSAADQDHVYGRSIRASKLTSAVANSQGNWLTGAPGAMAGNYSKLYYPINYATAVGDAEPFKADVYYLQVTAPPTITAGVVTPGTISNNYLATLPIDATTWGAHGGAIASMIFSPDGILYITVLAGESGFTGTGGLGGLVYQITLTPDGSAATGVNIMPAGTGWANGFRPYALCWHNGQLWCGTFRTTATPGGVYRLRPGVDTTWTLDRTLSDANGTGCTTLCSYNGVLYAGITASGVAGNVAAVEARDALGNWTTSLTAVGASATLVMEGAIVFNGKMYVARNSGVSNRVTTIYQFDGTTWSTVFTGSVGTHTACALSCSWVSLGVLSFGSGGHGVSTGLVQTADGATWTDRSTALVNSTGSTLSGLNAVGALSY